MIFYHLTNNNMFITHQHYENSVIWACSYVEVFNTFQDAKQNMIDTVYNCLSHCEKDTMDKIANFLNTYHDMETTIDDFVVKKFEHWYYITDKFNEAIYHLRILDTDAGDVSSDF